jgi:hypothetical protein
LAVTVVTSPVACGGCAHAPGGSVEHESPAPLLLLPPLLLPVLPPLLLELLELLELPELLEPELDDPLDDELPGPPPDVLPPHAPAATDTTSGIDTTNAA